MRQDAIRLVRLIALAMDILGDGRWGKESTPGADATAGGGNVEVRT